jgi:hypothetical protein
MDGIQDLARDCFGYGRWDKPYWFIGLEEGMSGSLPDRIRAFKEQNQDGLCDCKEFHLAIGDHSHHGERADVQSTWRGLMLFLLAYLEKPHSTGDLLAYQREQLGSAAGETALIELWGLPAKSLGEGKEQNGSTLPENWRRRFSRNAGKRFWPKCSITNQSWW